MADHEVEAIRTAYGAIASLPPSAHDRTLTWLNQRLAEDRRKGVMASVGVAHFARRLGRRLKRRATDTHPQGRDA